MSTRKTTKLAGLGSIGAIAALGLWGFGYMETPRSIAAPAVKSAPMSAIAVLHPTEGSDVHGTVVFTKVANGIRVTAYIAGLTPGDHGFHVHEKGDCSAPDATSAGGHFNPTNMPHGAPDDARRHIGDFGNVTADSSGRAYYQRVDRHIAFTGRNSIIGRAVIVHAGADDLKSQPSGDAGGRQACGVIGIVR